MIGMAILASTFGYTKWEEFLDLAIPVLVVLLVAGAYLISRNRIIAGIYYIMLSLIVLINIRLAIDGEWSRSVIPTFHTGCSIFDPTMTFFGTLAFDLAVLLALASPLIAPYSRRWVHRIFHRRKEESPGPDMATGTAEAGPKAFRLRSIVRKSWFPLTMLGIWLLLMFGNPQWCRLIYVYQECVKGHELSPPADYTGPWKEYSVLGTVGEGWIKNGKRQGIWYFNYQAQSVIEEYEDGKRHGLFILLNDRGVKVMEYHYKNGATDGLCTDRYADGTVLREFTDKDGVHDGPYRHWRDDGQLLTDCTFKDGKVWNGVYFKDIADDYENYGFLILVRDTYRNGVKDGPSRVWVEDYEKPEKVLAEGKWLNGLPWDGTVLTFADPAADDYRYWVRTYHQGKVDGPARLYAGNGAVLIYGDTRTKLGPDASDMFIVAEGDLKEITRENGSSKIVPVGLWRFCDKKESSVIIEGAFKDGRPWSGTFPRQDRQGHILDRCTFRDGEPYDGTYYVMAEPKSGLVLKYTYEAGKVVGPPVSQIAADTPLPLYLQN